MCLKMALKLFLLMLNLLLGQAQEMDDGVEVRRRCDDGAIDVPNEDYGLGPPISLPYQQGGRKYANGSDIEGPAYVNDVVAEGACDNPNIDRTTVRELCALPPDKGTSDDDILRYYFNPIVQQCIPFSYSGRGGNANRFLSVKNCYEICHAAEVTVKKPKVVAGIRAYLVPKPPCNKDASAAAGDGGFATRDVVVRQIPNPADPSKTLTIVQNAKYVYGRAKMGGRKVGAIIDDGSGTTRIVPTMSPRIKIVQRIVHPGPFPGAGGFGPYQPQQQQRRCGQRQPMTISNVQMN